MPFGPPHHDYMPHILITLLFLLLYALVALLVVELIILIISLFIAVPPKVRQILYAIVGVCLLIWLIEAFLGGVTIPTYKQ